MLQKKNPKTYREHLHISKKDCTFAPLLRNQS